MLLKYLRDSFDKDVLTSSKTSQLLMPILKLELDPRVMRIPSYPYRIAVTDTRERVIRN